MNDKELCKLFGTTVEKVEAECAKYESGDLSGFVFGDAIDGIPKSKMKTTSLRLPDFELAAIDRAAASQGLSRSAFIRRACDNEILAIA